MATRLNNQLLGPNAAGEGLRLPPHSIEAEQAVLGGLMLDSAAWDQVADRVNTEDFYRNDHRLIFAAVAGLIERNQPCDAVTLCGHMESQGLLDQVGGLSYLGSLARDTPTAANIRAYADIVRERSVLRQLITRGKSHRRQRARAGGSGGARNRRRCGTRGIRNRRAGLARQNRIQERQEHPAGRRQPNRRALSLRRETHRHLHWLQKTR